MSDCTHKEWSIEINYTTMNLDAAECLNCGAKGQVVEGSELASLRAAAGERDELKIHVIMLQAERDAARQRVAELERLKYEVIDIIAYDPRQRPSDEGDPSSDLLGRLWDAVDKTEQPADSKSPATNDETESP